MNRRRHITAVRLARMTFALAGGMLLVLIAFSSSADAGCGDYVFVRNANGQLVRASSLMPGEHAGTCSGPNCPGVHSQLATPETMPPSPDESLPIKLPCRGPNCSGRSQLPAAPVPPAPQRRARRRDLR